MCECVCARARASWGRGERASLSVCFLEALGRGEKGSERWLPAAGLGFSRGKGNVVDACWRCRATGERGFSDAPVGPNGTGACAFGHRGRDAEVTLEAGIE